MRPRGGISDGRQIQSLTHTTKWRNTTTDDHQPRTNTGSHLITYHLLVSLSVGRSAAPCLSHCHCQSLLCQCRAAMSGPLFLVTAAVGDTGSLTCRLLLSKGRRVRAFVRSSDERSDALKAIGAEIFEGDFLRFPSVRAAMEGVHAAYFCYPIAPGLIDATAYFAQAALNAKVSYVVNMSADNRQEGGDEQGISEPLDQRAGVRPLRCARHTHPTRILR